MSLNHTIFIALNNLAGKNPAFDVFVIFIAEQFDLIVIVLGIFFLLLHKRKFGSIHELYHTVKARWVEIILLVATSCLAWVVAKLLKLVFALPRPDLLLENVNLLVIHGGYDSFPSGHATFFAAFATILYLEHKAVGIVFGIFALLIGLARIVVGVHFPVDILAGFVIGIGVAVGIYMLFLRQFFYNRVKD